MSLTDQIQKPKKNAKEEKKKSIIYEFWCVPPRIPAKKLDPSLMRYEDNESCSPSVTLE